MSQTTPPIPEEIKRFLTGAKRHHYVAEFHQRRFSVAPDEEHPQIHLLDVHTGKTSKTSTLNSCVIQHHNTLFETDGLPAGFVEATLSAIEGMAAPVIEKLCAGLSLVAEEEEALALFLYFQQQRTPRGREALNFTLEQSGKYWMLKQIYEQREFHRERLAKNLGREPTVDEVGEAIQEMADDVEAGRIKVVPSRDHEVGSMFMSTETAVPLILEMCWTLVETPEDARFILSDEPLLRCDPAKPGASSGWRSSPTVEATLPLDPGLLLLLQQYPRLHRRRVVATRQQVAQLNMRTYASAREVILGPDQGLLQAVRMQAKKSTASVAQYRQHPPSFHVVETIDGDPHPPKVTTTKGPTKVTVRRGRQKPKAGRPASSSPHTGRAEPRE